MRLFASVNYGQQIICRRPSCCLDIGSRGQDLQQIEFFIPDTNESGVACGDHRSIAVDCFESLSCITNRIMRFYRPCRDTFQWARIFDQCRRRNRFSRFETNSRQLRRIHWYQGIDIKWRHGNQFGRSFHPAFVGTRCGFGRNKSHRNNLLLPTTNGHDG